MKKFSTPIILGVLCVIAVASVLYVAPYLKESSSPTQTARKSLNEMSLEEIVAEAKKEERVDSVGMPDSWANWGETWKDIERTYGLKHSDVELAVFEAEKNNATKDIGDVGQSFGPLAESKGLTIPFKTTYWESIPDWAKDDDGDWIIGYYGTITIITNRKLVPTPPKSFADILEGDYMVTAGDVMKGTQAQCAVLSAAIANGGSESDITPGLEFFKKLAEQERLDKGEGNMSRLEKGEIACYFLWDFNSLGYRDQFKKNNAKTEYDITVPSDGSVQSGYTTVINAYTKRPHAAALTREFILSDKGQINLAKGYAKPIRSDVKLPEDIAAKLLPDEQYQNARPIKDAKAWEETVKTLGMRWQEEVLAYSK